MKDYKLAFFCEYDKYPTTSYCAIHGVDESKNLGDITKVDETKLPYFNMIVGGSPCQDFSVAGKQKGSVWTCKECGHEYNPLQVHWSERDKCPECGSDNLEKTRSSLLVEWLRVIRANKPNFGIYENVKNIVGKEFKETTFKAFETELQEYGYNTYWKTLNAKNYGIPQNRERIYLILIKKELDNENFKYPEPFDNGLRLKDLLERDVDEKYYLTDDKVNKILNSNFMQEKLRIQTDDICGCLLARDYKDPKCVPIDKSYNNPNIIEYANCITAREDRGVSNRKKEGTAVLENNTVSIKQATKQGYIECKIGGVADLSYPESNTRRGRVQDGGDTCPTITATETGVCKIESPYRVRKLTPLECFRLMGFSDEAFYKAKAAGISDSQLYKQAGNSIVTNVLFEILVELHKAMPYLFDDLVLGSFFSGVGAFEVALNNFYEYIKGDMKQENFTRPQSV